MSKKLTVSRKAVTKHKRGAPKKTFVHDPDRYAIARADAFMALGASSNDAFATVAVQMLGEPVAEQDVAPRRKRGRGLIAGGVQITYERRAIGGGSAATFDGKASSLRRKAKLAETDPQAVAWRKAMGRAYILALTGKDHARCAAIIAELAAVAGEQAYARDVLLPLLAARTFLAARNYPRTLSRSLWRTVEATRNQRGASNDRPSENFSAARGPRADPLAQRDAVAARSQEPLSQADQARREKGGLARRRGERVAHRSHGRAL
jgi:hypothetical protein